MLLIIQNILRERLLIHVDLTLHFTLHLKAKPFADK